MRAFLLRVSGAAAVLGLGAGLAIGCSDGATEDTGSTGATGEAISTTDLLSHARFLPLHQDGTPIHKLVASGPKVMAPKQTASANDLTYRGGPLIQHVNVVPVFWGSSVPSQITSGMPGFYSQVTNSAYLDMLSEYSTNGMKIGRGSAAAGVTITPSVSSNSISDAQIASELDRQISAGHLPKNDNNSLYMVHFPPGMSIQLDAQSTSCVQFCAYHSTYKRGDGSLMFYGVHPDLSGGCAGGCGGSSYFNNSCSVASHEFAETITDPAVGLNTLSWYNDSQGEIGDICNAQQGTSGSYTVQKLWSNALGSCVDHNPNIGPQPGPGGQDGGAPPPPPPQDAGAPDASPPPPQDAGTHDAAPPPPPPPPPPGTCSNSEQEPNNTVQDADPLNGCLKGAVNPGTDSDLSWFSLNGSVAYDVKLTATGDATLSLYKWVNNAWALVANTTPTEVSHVSSGGGTYVAVVKSPGRHTQTYTLTLK